MKKKDIRGLLLILDNELKLLQNAADILTYSNDTCKKIGIKETYNYDELDKYESFTGRFSRLSDFLIQKIFRAIDELDLETPGTIRDRLNNAEKKGLIDSADTFAEIRILRNQIAHEYILEELQEMFKKVLEYTPLLLDCTKRVMAYCRKYKRD